MTSMIRESPLVMEPMAMPSPISAAAVPHRVAAFRALAFRLSNAFVNRLVVGSSSFAETVSRVTKPKTVLAISVNWSGLIRLITYMAPARIRIAVAMPVRVLVLSFFCQVLIALVSCLKVPEMELSIPVSGVSSIAFRLLVAFAICPMLNASSPTSIRLINR